MAERFKAEKVGPMWLIVASNGAEVARFEGPEAEVQARTIVANLNGKRAPTSTPALVDDVERHARAVVGQPTEPVAITGPESWTSEQVAQRRAIDLAQRCADGGQVVRYVAFGGQTRRAVVDRWDPAIKRGKAGFTARTLRDDVLNDGEEVWGYAAQVVGFEGTAEVQGVDVAPDAPEAPHPADELPEEPAPEKPMRATMAGLPPSWHPERGGFVRLLPGDRVGVSFGRMPPRHVRTSLKAAGFQWCRDDREWLGALVALPEAFRPDGAGGAA